MYDAYAVPYNPAEKNIGRDYPIFPRFIHALNVQRVLSVVADGVRRRYAVALLRSLIEFFTIPFDGG